MADPTSDRDLVTSRVINASPERVYRAFADPAQLARWWGPNGITNTFVEFDLRPGGKWRLSMHGPDGADYPNESRFAEVMTNERVVLDHLSAPRFRLTISFAPHGKGTLVGWCQSFETADVCRRVARYAVDGNEQNLDRLAAHLASR